MGYYEHLCALLDPLGVYATARGTYSGSELYAAGEALDRVAAALEHAEREAVLMTADEEGIARREQLFARHGANASPALRRRAAAALSRIGGDSFTPAEINRAIEGCGIDARVEETDTPGTVRVSFPDSIGVPDEFEQIERIVSDIIPCHLAIEYAFRFLTWAAFEANGWTWQSLETAGQTWQSLEVSVSF